MLNDKQLNQVESLFLDIDSKKIDKTYHYLINESIRLVFMISPSQGEYLLWLLNRWVFLRNDNKHLPKRFGQYFLHPDLLKLFFAYPIDH